MNSRKNMSIISIINDTPVMENKLGVRYCPVKTAQGYGLGHFEWNGTVFGKDEPAFLMESSLNWPYAAPQFEILENTEKRGVIRFYGISTKIRLDITVTLEEGSHLVTFDMALEPMLPVYKRLYAPISFGTEDIAFVKYPYEDTLTPANLRSFEIETDYARVPFIFGRKVSGAYIGAGYYLTDDFANGRISFEKEHEEFRISTQFRGMVKENDIQLGDFPSPNNIRFTDLGAGIRRSVRHMRFVVSMGGTQYDLFRNYMDECGYDFNVFFKYDADHYEEDWIDILEHARYFDGKGYSIKISTDTGDMDLVSPHGSYGTIISTPTQMENACILYNYFRHHPEAEWARTRAFEMADFFVSEQRENGMVPAYNADLGSKPQGMAIDADKNPYAGGHAVGMLEEALGVDAMMRFYEAVKECEGVAEADGDEKIDEREKKAARGAKETWYQSALKLANWICSEVDAEGRVGRNYFADGSFDMYSYAMLNALIPMDRFADVTGESRFSEARDRLEKYVWENYIATDDFVNLVGDSTSWMGSEGVPDNDCVGLLGLMSYCAMRHAKTGDEKYVNTAKDIFVYLWACNCPIDMPGFTHPTRGLMREQDFYCCFDSALVISAHSVGLPYFAKAAQDPAFMQFYAIAMQTLLSLQEKNDRYHGIHLGLEADTDGLTPTDKVAEGKHVYISMGFGMGILASMLNPLHYRYTGGKDWGVGMDYRVDFSFDDLKDVPYVTACSSVIRQIGFNPETSVLQIWCYDLTHTEVDLEVKWDGPWSMEKSVVYYGYEKALAAELCEEGKKAAAEVRDGECGLAGTCLKIHVSSVDVPSKMVQIKLEK